jgi:hypothetical protein
MKFQLTKGYNEDGTWWVKDVWSIYHSNYQVWYVARLPDGRILESSSYYLDQAISYIHLKWVPMWLPGDEVKPRARLYQSGVCTVPD